MTGRLASGALAAAGVPEAVYEAPAGFAAAVTVRLINDSAAAVNVQAKAGAGIAAPDSAFSLPTIVSGQGWNGFEASPFLNGSTPENQGAAFAIVGNYAYAGLGSNSLRRIDLTNQLAPTVSVGLSAESNNTFSRDQRQWNTAAANRMWVRSSTSLTRYIDSTSTPFLVGATTYVYTGVAHGAGHGDAAIGCDASSVSGQYYYTAAAPTTGGGTANINTLSSYTATFSGVSDANYRDTSRSRFYYANGVWFFVSLDGSNQPKIWSTSTPATAASWKSHTTPNVGSVGTNDVNRVHIFHHSGQFWLAAFFTSGSAARIYRTVDTLAATNPAWFRVYDSNTNYSGFLQTAGANFLRSDGLFYMKTDTAVWLTSSDGPLTEVAWQKPGVALGPKNAHYLGKIAAPANFSPLFNLVTAGATDTVNDITSYATDRIYRWITDSTWGLNTVGNAGQWLAPPSALNANTALVTSGVMLSPGDKIWVRSSAAGLGVRVDGFLQKVT